MQSGNVDGDRQAAPAALTRGQTARRLGVAVATVRRMEGTKLHPRRENGQWFFDAQEVEHLARERATEPRPRPARRTDDGDLAAEVFALLDQRRSFSAIVRQTRESPGVIRKIYRDWRSGFGDTPGSAPDSRVDDETLEVQRVRDEKELRRWETQMRKLESGPENVDDEPEGIPAATADEDEDFSPDDGAHV